MAPKRIRDLIAAQTVQSLQPSDTAHAAARLMSEHNVSAVIVAEADQALVGIVTERDLSRRVVAADRLGSQIELREIMTTDPAVVAPEDPVSEGLAKMQSLGVRHLPVVEDGRLVGVVSMRALQDTVSAQVVAV